MMIGRHKQYYINHIKFQTMKTRLSIFDNYQEELTISDLEGLLCSTLCKQRCIEHLSTDNKSKIGPIEVIQDDVVVTPVVKESVEA